METEHLVSKILVNEQANHTCSMCPARLYEPVNRKVVFGIGNTCAKVMFILPNYDITTKSKYKTLLDVLAKAYEKVTGFNMFEQVYTTRLIKCYTNSNYDIIKACTNFCISYLYTEIKVVRPENVVFFGNTYENYIKGGGKPFTNVIECISPGVLFYDNEDTIKVFYEQLAEALR